MGSYYARENGKIQIAPTISYGGCLGPLTEGQINAPSLLFALSGMGSLI